MLRQHVWVFLPQNLKLVFRYFQTFLGHFSQFQTKLVFDIMIIQIPQYCDFFPQLCCCASYVVSIDRITCTSMVKYTTSLPCIGLRESGSKPYTNFDFCEGKNHKHLNITLHYKAKQFMLTNYFSRKVYIFLKTV
jgi:hypothetical protein